MQVIRYLQYTHVHILKIPRSAKLWQGKTLAKPYFYACLWMGDFPKFSTVGATLHSIAWENLAKSQTIIKAANTFPANILHHIVPHKPLVLCKGHL